MVFIESLGAVRCINVGKGNRQTSNLIILDLLHIDQIHYVPDQPSLKHENSPEKKEFICIFWAFKI
jgi:hypothetical protein